MCRCYHCKEYFIPNNGQVSNRLNSLNNNNDGKEIHLYCCDEHKLSCGVYRARTTPRELRNITKRARCNQPINRKALLDNQEDEFGYTYCEKCGRPLPREELIIHHNIMVGKDHTMADDMSHQIIVCDECHEHKGC